MTTLFAPILAFTCDEIWLAMPHRTGDDARNVLFNEMVQPYAAYALSEDGDGQVGAASPPSVPPSTARWSRPVPTRPSARVWRPRWT